MIVIIGEGNHCRGLPGLVREGFAARRGGSGANGLARCGGANPLDTGVAWEAPCSISSKQQSEFLYVKFCSAATQ